MTAPPTPRPVAERLRRHSATRVMVLPDHKVMFLPIPKSGCTSMLWTLSTLAGLPRERFTGTRTAEISRAMAIHDTGLWDAPHRWSSYDAQERSRILGADDWLRFSIVRDPAPRLWSAWQSKVLLMEPRFVERFADQDWFPHQAASVDGVVEAFRSFVAALDTDPEQAPHDAHWGSQSGLMEGFGINWTGRAERPSESLARLQSHVGAGVELRTESPRENANPIPFHPSVYDEQAAERLGRLFADDYAAFGYAPFEVRPDPDEADWRELAASRLLLVNELAERHQRIGELLGTIAELEGALDAARREQTRPTAAAALRHRMAALRRRGDT